MTELAISTQILCGGESFSGQVHASSVAIDGYAVLIGGPSGAGKSDLALRLIDRGAMLISDDYTLVERHGDGVIARTPATIRDMIEVRGLGVLPMPHVENVRIGLIVIASEDNNGRESERFPLSSSFYPLCGVQQPLLRLNLHEASAPIKVELALHRMNMSLVATEKG